MITALGMSKRAQILTAFALVYVVWGSNFIAIRYAAQAMNPALLSGLRFLFASLLLFLFLRVRGCILRMTPPEYRTVAVLGIVMFCVNTVLVNYGSRTVSAGLTALILATIPLMIGLLLSFLPSGQPMTTVGWVGTIIGFIGVVVLIRATVANQSLADSSFRAFTALLIAAAAWACGSVMAQRMVLVSPPLVLSAWQMLIGGGINLVIGVLTGGIHQTRWTAPVWGAVLYLAVFGSLAGYTSYLFLLRNVRVSFVATYAYVNPVVAVILGTTMQHESLHGLQWGGMLMVLTSVGLVVAYGRPASTEGYSALQYRSDAVTDIHMP